MTRTPSALSVVAVAAVLAQSGVVRAQPQRFPHETMRETLKLSYTGTEKWVLYLNSTDLKFRRKPVADFPSEEQAGMVRDKLNRLFPLSSPYFYQAEERPGDAPQPPLEEPAPGTGKKIEIDIAPTEARLRELYAKALDAIKNYGKAGDAATKRQADAANELIDKFNKAFAEFTKKNKAPEKMAPLQRVGTGPYNPPKEPADDTVPLLLLRPPPPPLAPFNPPKEPTGADFVGRWTATDKYETYSVAYTLDLKSGGTGTRIQQIGDGAPSTCKINWKVEKDRILIEEDVPGRVKYHLQISGKELLFGKTRYTK